MVLMVVPVAPKVVAAVVVKPFAVTGQLPIGAEGYTARPLTWSTHWASDDERCASFSACVTVPDCSQEVC